MNLHYLRSPFITGATMLLITSGVFMAVSAAQAEDLDQSQYDQVIVKKLQLTKKLQLKSKNAAIIQKGSRPVKVDDNFKVTGKSTFKKAVDIQKVIRNTKGDVTVKDNLVPKTDSTYDLGTTDLAWSNLYADNIVLNGETVALGEQLPDGCATNEVAKYNGTAWACAADVDTDTDTNTTYTAGDGLALTGTTFAMSGTSYDNIIVVAKSGGDYTTIASALASITDNTDTNGYVIYVAPGVYEETFSMKQYVDIIGASEKTVTISGTGGSAVTDSTIQLASDSKLAHVKVQIEATTETAGSVIYGDDVTDTLLEHIEVYATGISTTLWGINITDSGSEVEIRNADIRLDNATNTTGINVTDASLVVENSFIAATGPGASAQTAGLVNDGGFITAYEVVVEVNGASGVATMGVIVDGSGITRLHDSEIVGAGSGSSVDYGAYIPDGRVDAMESNIRGSDNSIFNSDTANVAHTSLSGAIDDDSSAGTFTCIGAYDFSAFTALDTSCL